MPLAHLVATRLIKQMADVRKCGRLWWLRPDGKAKVSVEYVSKSDGSVEPQRVHTVCITVRCAAPAKALRTQECIDYDGPEMIAPSFQGMQDMIVEEVIKKTLAQVCLKNGQSAITLFGDHTQIFICESPASDTKQLQGPSKNAGYASTIRDRKMSADACSGDDHASMIGDRFSRMDRSAAHLCRQIAKSIVKSGLCMRAKVRLTYALGIEKPLALTVDTYGTEQGNLTVADIANVIKLSFDCRPGAIAASLALRDPKYNEVASDCNLEREPWEQAKDLSKYSVMTSEGIVDAVMLSNCTTKWDLSESPLHGA